MSARVFNFNGANTTFNDIHDNIGCTIVTSRPPSDEPTPDEADEPAPSDSPAEPPMLLPSAELAPASTFPDNSDCEPSIPPLLATEPARALLNKLQAAEMLDADYRPLCSRTQAALIANQLAERLQIPNKWTVFEQLWGCRALSTYYQKAVCMKGLPEMEHQIEQVLS